MDKVPQKRKMKIADEISSEELEKIDKRDLVERIKQLEAHNNQLKNIISKNNLGESESGKRKKPFDFSRCHFRKVLLRILYFGWDYKGLVVQEDSSETIENHLFNALHKACLIENRETSDYHRCGRTDKGVSAFGQVISIRLRSKFSEDEQPKNFETEMPYCKILNRLLPEDIRAICWMPIPQDRMEYSARFDCKSRLYRYYFPRSDLDIEAMRSACSHIVGSHDFRNLCKMDVGNGVTEFVRHVLKADIIWDSESPSPLTMCYLEIEGNAFLWHQIRCIFGILMLIGQGKESPQIVKELLDIEKNPRKPQYFMALDVPLNLYKCSYDLEEKQNWVYDEAEMICLIKHMQSLWTLHSVKSTMVKDCLASLEGIFKNLPKSEMQNKETGLSERDSVMAHTECLLQGVKTRVYKPLLKRDMCSSLEERIEHYKKKRKVPSSEDMDV